MRYLSYMRLFLEKYGLLSTWIGLIFGLSLFFTHKYETAYWAAKEGNLIESLTFILYLTLLVLLAQLNRYATRSLWLPAVLAVLFVLRELDFQLKLDWLGLIHTDDFRFTPSFAAGPLDAAASAIAMLLIGGCLALAAWSWGPTLFKAARGRDVVALSILSGVACLPAAKILDAVWKRLAVIGIEMSEYGMWMATYFEEVLEFAVPWFFCQAAALALLRATPAVAKVAAEERRGAVGERALARQG